MTTAWFKNFIFLELKFLWNIEYEKSKKTLNSIQILNEISFQTFLKQIALGMFE